MRDATDDPMSPRDERCIGARGGLESCKGRREEKLEEKRHPGWGGKWFGKLKKKLGLGNDRGFREKGYVSGNEKGEQGNGERIDDILTVAVKGHVEDSVYIFGDSGCGYTTSVRTEEHFKWDAHRKSVSSAACCQGERELLITGSRDLSIKCWKYDNNLECVGSVPDAHELTVSAVATAYGEGGCFATGSRDTCVAVWDIDAAQNDIHTVCKGSVPRNLVTCMGFHGPGPNASLAQGSEDLCVRMWDWAREGMSKPTTILKDYVYFPLCLDVDEHYLLTGCKGFNGDGCEVCVWDMRQSAKPLAKMSGHQQDVVACQFAKTQNGKRVAVSASKDNYLHIWDLDTFTCHHTIQQAFETPCTTMIVSKNTILTTSFDGEVERHLLC
mmetsp:Transcript_29192/g.46939  ORF Transcript_29192/g.46939 Transcript_29192/m.46939 type:complete len:384 (+) Transcript_29192:115-1266(+)